MKDIKATIARNVTNLRKELNLSQSSLAKKSGICTTYIGEIETCRKYPSIKTLVKIATSLKVEPYVLLIDAEKDKNDVIVRYNDKLREEFDVMLQKMEVFR